MSDVLHCPECDALLEDQPIVDLTVPFYCPTCKCCYGYSIVAIVDVDDTGEKPKLVRIKNLPLHRETQHVDGKPYEIWKPGAPERRKSTWFK